MIEWEETAEGLRVIDHANVELRVGMADGGLREGEPEIPRPTDETLAGVASELELPGSYVKVTATDREYTRNFLDETGPVELPGGEYLLNVDANVKLYLRFEGPATLRKDEDFETTWVRFPDVTELAMGFRSHHEYPAGTITVEPTPAGLAEGLSHLPSSLKTTDPNRSFPTLRGHPPRLETGDRTDVPADIEAATPDTGVRLSVPPDLDALFVVAPLAQYLGAEVTADADDRPVLSAPAADLTHPLPALPDLQDATADLLRRVFYLDCLVRTVGPYGTGLVEADALESVAFDPGRVYEAGIDQRLAEYLAVPWELIEDRLPEWHLSTYVQPTADRARCLPFLLDQLSLVFLPEASELDSSELIRHSLDDFFRGGSPGRAAPGGPEPGQGGGPVRRTTGPDGGPEPGDRPGDESNHERSRGPTWRAADDDVVSVDLLEPELRTGRMHGWLAEGVPIDVYKSTYAAYENQLDYLERGGDGIQVEVVLNDESMVEEHDEVARIYRERAEELPMEVTVSEHLGRESLASVFESPVDFVHYIGHCEETGLRCPDGNLSIDDVEESNAQTFFLNACGSYHEGMSLIEKGSVVGGVTFKRVLDRQAATVGTTFARLLVMGFSFDRAMQLARRRIMTGKDYAVIGDGTHSLTQHRNLAPVQYDLREDDDGYSLEADVYSPDMVGASYYVTLDDGDDRSYLHGNRSTYRLEAGQLAELLDRSVDPVIFDGDLTWSTELAENLRD